MTKARAPQGLQAAGRRFWAAMVVDDAVGVGRLRLIEAAARTLDDLEQLQAALVNAPATVEGSTGQTRPHPLYGEIRAHRGLLAKLLQQLGVQNPSGKSTPASRSDQARRAARARWGDAVPVIASPGFAATSPSAGRDDDLSSLYGEFADL